MTKPNKSLADYMRESETNVFLQTGPPAPTEGWIYRDFRPMLQPTWRALVELLGADNVRVIAQSTYQSDEGDYRTRAQIWISPAAQEAWRSHLVAAS